MLHSALRAYFAELDAVTLADLVRPGTARPPRAAGVRPRCNLLGPTALGFRHRDDLREITGLLTQLGVDINVVAPLGATPDDHTRQCAAAALGVFAHVEPEFAQLGEKTPGIADAGDRMHALAREGREWTLAAALQQVRIAIDCMGGDHGPAVTLPACQAFLASHPAAELVLVGTEEALRPVAAWQRCRLQVASEVVTMNDAFKAEAWLTAKVAQEKSSGKQRKILTRFVTPR